MDRQAFKQRMQNLKSYRENNPGKGYWDFKQQQAPGPYSAGELVKSIEEFTNHEEYLGPPSHNYDFTLSEEWADKHGYYPDERGHRDDRVKKEAHPTHPSKGEWKSQYQFDLTDKGIEDPNFILYGLNDGGQDPQATMTYRGGIVLPELTVTPKGNYIYNSYDNIKAYWPGGETGESEKERFYQATGRSSSGRPLEEGLKPVFSLEDAANMTPIGDAISAKDAYDAVKNRDWLGAGLAALTVVPFVPNAIKRVTPTVRRTGTDQIDRILRAQNKEAKMATRLNNETYNIVERLMDDPSYMRRAQQVKNKYGDDYTSIYADIINAYNESPELLPKAKGSLSLGEARGKMQTQGSATTRHKEGGDFPKIGEYDYVFNIDRGVPYGSTTHEINHFSDFLKNQSPDAVGSSNMYKWMRSAIKPYSDSVSKYFSSPTEQKAYMNQLREFMYTNKMIDTRDQVVTPSLIKTALDKLPKGMDSIKKASDQFKSLKSYTKWFNTVPLLGVGAIGANKYFTNNESRN